MFSLFQITIHSKRQLPPIHSQTFLHFTPASLTMATARDCTSSLTHNGQSKGLYKLTYTQWPQQGTVQAHLQWPQQGTVQAHLQWPQQGTVQAHLHTMAKARDCTSSLTHNGQSKGLYKLTYNGHSKGLYKLTYTQWLTHTQWPQQGTAYSHTMATTRDCLLTHNGHNKGLLTHTQWPQQGIVQAYSRSMVRACARLVQCHFKVSLKLVEDL